VIVVDVNVLVATFRTDHPQHEAASAWLNPVLADPSAAVVVPDLVWVGFVRIVTNVRILNDPADTAQAAGFVEAVVATPGYRSVPGLTTGISRFTDVCKEANATANLVTDAYIAAVALSLGCPVASFDRDFRRFDGLTIVVPQ